MTSVISLHAAKGNTFNHYMPYLDLEELSRVIHIWYQLE